MFLIDDEAHAELQEGEFETREQAMAELRRRASIPWNAPPNLAPCTNWQKCGRRYELVEFDGDAEVSRRPALNISAAGVQWLIEER